MYASHTSGPITSVLWTVLITVSVLILCLHQVMLPRER